MRVVRGLAWSALAAGPLWGVPTRSEEPQAQPAPAAVAVNLPAIDALVAGRLALACDAIDAGRAPDAAGSDELLERPEVLQEALCSVLEHAAWRVPGSGATPWIERRLEQRHRPYLRTLAAQLSVQRARGAARADLAAGAAPARLRARVVLAGEVARALDVRLLAELAAAAGARGSAVEFEVALCSTLRRNASACRELDAAWEQLAPGLRVAALDALVGCARPSALSVLARRLDDQPELRAAVLARMGALAQTLEEPVRRAPGGREAALCAGRLEDAESVPRLVELLESTERSERDAAHWALRRISRLGFAADARPWRLWLADEQEWWSERWPLCLAALGDPRSARAVAALDEIARRRLGRDELALAVAEMGGVDADLAERRCLALGALASRAGLGYLRECMTLGDESLRRAAAAAWRTASDLPPPLEGGARSGVH
jgi:hypothetical protein